MAVKSGKFGWVDGVPCVRVWETDWINEVIQYSASCTGGTTAAFPGINDWTGRYGAYGASSPKYPGSGLFLFTGLTAESLETENPNTWDGWQGNAIMESIDFSFEFGENQLFSYIANVLGEGAPAYPEGRIPTPLPSEPDNPGLRLDSSPEAANADCKVTLSTMRLGPGDDLEFEIEDVVSTNFTITEPQIPYASTSTGSYRARIPGNISFTGNLSVLFEKYQDTNPTLNIPSISPRFWTAELDNLSQYRIRIYTDATKFWDIGPVSFQQVNRVVQRESGEPNIGQWSMIWTSIYDDVDNPDPDPATPTLGWIRDPEGVFVYGQYPDYT